MRPEINDILIDKSGAYYKVITYGKNTYDGDTMIVYENIRTKGVLVSSIQGKEMLGFRIAIKGSDLFS